MIATSFSGEFANRQGRSPAAAGRGKSICADESGGKQKELVNFSRLNGVARN
jgi:hypothetical protein